MIKTAKAAPAAAFLEEKPCVNTIIDQILQADIPENEKSAIRVADDIGATTGAAFETTAAVLRLIVYYVYSNPRTLTKLRAELDILKNDTSKDLVDIKAVALEQLPYLTAVLSEGLRLSPGSASRLARVAPDRSIYYDGWEIPAGTPVGMTTILMHTDEKNFPEPKSFIPERWMDAETAKAGKKAFAPFSKGTRSCIGMQ